MHIRSDRPFPSLQPDASAGHPPPSTPLEKSNPLLVDSMVDSADRERSTPITESEIRRSFCDTFRRAAQDPAGFHTLLRTAFGDGYDAAQGEALRTRALGGDVRWLPEIRFTTDATLRGGNGCYEADTGTVFLNAGKRTDRALMIQTFLEEAGHHLDTLLNRSDARGDEGEIFRRVLSGETLSSAALAQIRAENDHASIVVHGVRKEVEFWFWDDIGRAFQDAGRWIDTAVHDAGQWIDTAFRDAGRWTETAFKDAGHWIDTAAADAGRRLGDAGTSLLTGLRDAGVGIVRNLGEAADAFGNGLARIFKGDLRGFEQLGLGLLKIVQTPVDALIQIGGKVVSGVQTIIGVEPPGVGLTAEEVALARAVFGDSIDYSRVRIKRGNAGLFSNTERAFVLGDTIYLKGSTDIHVLIHELTHIWQHQNGGTDYASEALLSQAVDGNEAYSWADAIQHRPWSELEPERQAAFVEAASRASAFSANPPAFPPTFSLPAGLTLRQLNSFLDTVVRELRSGRGAP